MRRREFITLIGGAAAAWPLAARAQQQGERMRRIGVLMASAADDSEHQARMAAFLQGLAQLGWTDGRNVRIDTRWATTNADDLRRHAAELAALAPDVILSATGTATVAPLLQATRTVPIVFTIVIDPVGAGFVASLARPGGNATGFLMFEYGLSGKWLELLKQIAPGVTRAAVLRDPAIASGIGQFAAVHAVAPSLGVELSPVDVRDAPEIERAVTAFARTGNGGLIVTASGPALLHRNLIVTLASLHKLPAVYGSRPLVTAGGLISYSTDLIDQFRRAAGYVDRILKGEKPADLPVQAPTKYELVINLKTAKALGIVIPQTLLAQADEVIEMKRREFITQLGGAAASSLWPLAARAQQAGKVYRIGILEMVSAASNAANFDSLRKGLRDLGYVEGQNLVIDYRSADGRVDRFPQLATELVRLKVDLFVTRGTPAVIAAKNATATIPVVMAASGDPLRTGVVGGLAQPGGNVTGLSGFTLELLAKRLEILHEAIPGIKRIGFLHNMGNPVAPLQWEELKTAATALGIEARLLDVRNSEDIARAFDAAVAQRADTLVVGNDTVIQTNRRHVVDLAVKHRLPAMYHAKEFVDAGGLMTYAVSYPDLSTFVDKIFKGAKPTDLPVEQPTKFELVINLKSAKAIGLAIPGILLARADEVIE